MACELYFVLCHHCYPSSIWPLFALTRGGQHVLCALVSFLLQPLAGGPVPSVVCHSRDGTCRAGPQPRRCPPWEHHPATLGKDSCPTGGLSLPILSGLRCVPDRVQPPGWLSPAGCPVPLLGRAHPINAAVGLPWCYQTKTKVQPPVTTKSQTRDAKAKRLIHVLHHLGEEWTPTRKTVSILLLHSAGLTGTGGGGIFPIQLSPAFGASGSYPFILRAFHWAGAPSIPVRRFQHAQCKTLSLPLSGPLRETPPAPTGCFTVTPGLSILCRGAGPTPASNLPQKLLLSLIPSPPNWEQTGPESSPLFLWRVR